MVHRDTTELDHSFQCVLEKALMSLRVLKMPTWTLVIVTRAVLYGVVSHLLL
jgi:hypothetical protein